MVFTEINGASVTAGSILIYIAGCIVAHVNPFGLIAGVIYSILVRMCAALVAFTFTYRVWVREFAKEYQRGIESMEGI